jgi:integrase
MKLIFMGHAFNLALKEWEWVTDNPVAKVAKEKVNNLIERCLTDEEEARLLAASPIWLQRIIQFALQTGRRQGELLKLQWPQVDLFGRTMTILEQKNHAVDTLPLNEDVLKSQAKVRHLRSTYVFATGHGTRMNARNVCRDFAKACEKAKIETFRFHDLRQTFATRLVRAGVDLYSVQKLGRWKTVSMVMRYAHHYPESLRPGVEALARVHTSTKKAHSGELENLEA